MVFKLDKTGKETVLYNFTGTGGDGTAPYAGLVRDAKGNFYGTTSAGGTSGFGTVFMLDKTGKETVLYTFTGPPDGAYPCYGSLVRDAKGSLYGTTWEGGDSKEYCGSKCGTVFRVDKSGKETVLHSFTGGADGVEPVAGLVRDVKGNLYGPTGFGGASRAGVVFKLDKTGKETVLYTFTYGADGAYPNGLVRDAAGNLYGTTYAGGNSGCSEGCGVVFKLDKTGNETVLYSFTGPPDGAGSIAGLFWDEKGNLYGTTYGGGAHGIGTVFKLDRTGKETVLHSFAYSDGGYPFAGVVRDAAGNLYGTTSVYGASGYGTVWTLTP